MSSHSDSSSPPKVEAEDDPESEDGSTSDTGELDACSAPGIAIIKKASAAAASNVLNWILSFSRGPKQVPNKVVIILPDQKIPVWISHRN